MSTAQKLITAASGVGGEGLYVEEIFSTTIYTGTGSSLSITNNLDLSGEGGFVWFKSRSATRNHSIYDTARGTGKRLLPNNQGAGSAETTDNNGLSAFLSNGFTVVSADDCNQSGDLYVSWAWRKAEKFCDIVTYTGNEDSDRYIAHNLGVAPGMMIIKDRSANGVWTVYHRSLGGTKHLRLSSTDAAITDSGTFDNNSPTDTTFAVGLDGATNGNGNDYVCWLFAHNNNDGGFGADADQDIIKCSSYAGNGSSSNQIDLDFEPQWIMIKNITSSSGIWLIFDYERGVASGGGDDFYLQSNSNAVEGQFEGIEINADGFKITSNNASTNNSGNTYVYMAIRRGPMKVPEVGTTVFMPSAYRAGTRPSVATVTTAGFMPDLYATQSITGTYNVFFDKVRGKGVRLRSDGNNSESTDATNWLRSFDPTGVTLGGDTGAAIVNYNGFSYRDLFFRRAPSFFDIQAWSGDNAVPRNISHSLGVAPELIILKNRSASGGGANWVVGVASLGSDEGALNNDNGFAAYNNITTYSTTTFTLLNGAEEINKSGNNYIAYLFASAVGVSKVGTYTGNGSSLTIDCGFSNGARFVMTKRTDAGGHWNVFDTARSFDERLEWDTAAAEANGDWLDADNSGFIAKYVASNSSDSNISGAEYMFLAIA